MWSESYYSDVPLSAFHSPQGTNYVSNSNPSLTSRTLRVADEFLCSKAPRFKYVIILSDVPGEVLRGAMAGTGALMATSPRWGPRAPSITLNTAPSPVNSVLWGCCGDFYNSVHLRAQELVSL